MTAAGRIYATVAPIYREHGWAGVLPLPAGEKASPPTGFTGDAGAYPDDHQVEQWIRTHAAGNVGLRMPDNVIGIDVDQYTKAKDDGTEVIKHGADDIVRLEGELGVALPPTWTSTARPAPSGVRWFRVPPGHRFVGEVTDSIEILQRHHRYAVVPPSIHPDTGEKYRWITPDGAHGKRPPRPEELAELPAEWVERLLDRSEPVPKRDPIPPRPVPTGAPERSRSVQKVLDERTPWTNGSRHPQARDLSMRLARLEERGHPGASEALDFIGSEFCAAIDGEPGRRPEKEWRDLVEGARRRVAETMPDTPEYAEILAERSHRAECTPSRHHDDGAPVPPDDEPDPTDPGPAEPPADEGQAETHLAELAARMTAKEQMLPDTFWTARPALDHIRTAAHSRIRSADNVLHGVLARLCAYTPHTIELPPLAGAAGSLNYFALAIGHSGAGKSSGSAIADELLPRPAGLDCPERPLGSGEGLAENYMGTVAEETGDGGKKNVRRQTLYNVFVYGDEGAALTEMMDRKGATLPEALRRAWTGGALGQANATTERTRVIPAGRYRLGLLISFQPQVAAKLMADDTAGTPQRFLFASAVDPNVPDVDQLPEWPGQLEVPTIPLAEMRAHEDRSAGYMRHRMGVHADIADEVRTDAVQRARGQHEDGALDSHRPLHLLKTAGLLAILDGRLDITPDDWHLAKIIWNTSCQVRAGVIAAVRHAAEQEEAKRIERHAAREHAAEAARGAARSDVIRISLRLARWIHNTTPPPDGHPRRALLHRLASKERHLTDAAISHAIEADWLTEDSDGRYHAGGNKP